MPSIVDSTSTPATMGLESFFDHQLEIYQSGTDEESSSLPQSYDVHRPSNAVMSLLVARQRQESVKEMMSLPVVNKGGNQRRSSVVLDTRGMQHPSGTRAVDDATTESCSSHYSSLHWSSPSSSSGSGIAPSHTSSSHVVSTSFASSSLIEESNLPASSSSSSSYSSTSEDYHCRVVKSCMRKRNRRSVPSLGDSLMSPPHGSPLHQQLDSSDELLEEDSEVAYYCYDDSSVVYSQTDASSSQDSSSAAKMNDLEMKLSEETSAAANMFLFNVTYVDSFEEASTASDLSTMQEPITKELAKDVFVSRVVPLEISCVDGQDDAIQVEEMSTMQESVAATPTRVEQVETEFDEDESYMEAVTVHCDNTREGGMETSPSGRVDLLVGDVEIGVPRVSVSSTQAAKADTRVVLSSDVNSFQRYVSHLTILQKAFLTLIAGSSVTLVVIVVVLVMA